MRALALVDHYDHVCCRYRIRAFEQDLRRRGGEIDYRAIAKNPIDRIAQMRAADQYDVVILQRKLLSGFHLRILRKRARRLVYDFDDALAYRDSNDARGPHCGRRARRFSRIVKAADAVIAGNAFLAGLARDFGANANHVVRIPTCVDPENYPNVPSGSDRRTSGFDLVWIGSGATLRSLDEKREVWRRLGECDRAPRVRLKVICDRFPTYPPLEVVNVRWNALTEASELAASDAGVSVLPNDLWSEGKCGLKVLQYQAAGLPVVANRWGVHAEMVVPGVTGLLADTPGEWFDAVRALAEDRESAWAWGRSARLSVAEKYAPRVWAEAFAGALFGGMRVSAGLRGGRVAAAAGPQT